MGTLGSDLLNLARNDSGRLHLRCCPLMADDVLIELYERMAPQAAHHLQQCLSSLVDNALFYGHGPVAFAASTGPAGELVLHLRGRGARGDLRAVRARQRRPGQPPPRQWHRPLGGAAADRGDGRPGGGADFQLLLPGLANP